MIDPKSTSKNYCIRTPLVFFVNTIAYLENNIEYLFSNY